MTFDVQGQAELREKLRPELVHGPAAKLVSEASAFSLSETRSGARGLGGIPGSLSANVRGLEARVSSSHRGALPMEFGRRPGAARPPASAFARYGPSLGFVIARSVARRGIRGRFFMRKATARLRNTELPRLLDVMAQRIRERWGR